MGADAFTVYYGLRFRVSEEELDMLQERAHPHQIAARKCGLRCYFGRPTNGVTTSFSSVPRLACSVSRTRWTPSLPTSR